MNWTIVLGKLKEIGIYMLARFEESGTWAATGGGFVLIHQIFPGVLGDKITAICAGLSLILAVLIPEKGA